MHNIKFAQFYFFLKKKMESLKADYSVHCIRGSGSHNLMKKPPACYGRRENNYGGSVTTI